MDIRQLYDIYCKNPHVVIDSRRAGHGTLFFALKGSNVDGNQFAAAALEEGAAYAIVDDPAVVADERFLLTDDVLTTLQDLARHHRQQFDIPIIAITGSNGKTTTKELVAAVLGSHYPLHYTRGNLNNHIGVPLTLLEMPEGTEVAVIEMGANHQGEIHELCHIAEPTHGLITNIGAAHLEGFGGIEGVKKGKSELYRYLAARQGTTFVNMDEPFLDELSADVAKRVFYVRSQVPSPSYPPTEIVLQSAAPFLRIAFLGPQAALVEVQSHLIGLYNMSNLMTAVALGKYFKVPADKIKAAIEQYVPTNNRSQLLEKDGRTYILDAYNANPDSMKQAVLNLAAMEAPFKAAMLGDMLELGDETAAAHLRIAELAAQQGFDLVLLVGPLFAHAAAQLSLRHFDDAHALRQWLSEQTLPAGLYLVKASRGMGLERILD